jgi:hypothetical protein
MSSLRPETEPRVVSAGFDDLPTTIALAALAVCTTACAHEALGHGFACLILGGRITLLNSAFFRCSAPSPIIDIAGPAGNLLVGFMAFALQGLVSRKRPELCFYALCVMAFSLFWEAGYVIFSMLRSRGDYFHAWIDFVGPMNWIVRLGGVAMGLAAYMIFSRMLALRARVYAAWPRRIPHLLRPAWITGVVAMAASASLFAPDRLGAMHDAGFSAVAAFPLLFPYAYLKSDGEPAKPIARDWRVIAGGVAGLLAFAFTMGRGIY